MSDEAARSLRGTWLPRSAFDPELVLGGEDCRAVDGDGRVLAILRKGALSGRALDGVAHALVGFRAAPKNRGSATLKGMKIYMRKRDGTLSRTQQIPEKLARGLGDSGVVSYLGRGPRRPFCRACHANGAASWRMRELEQIALEAELVYAESYPEKYGPHVDFVNANVKRCWRLRDSVFTTITVNVNYRTAVHQDGGNLVSGMAVMACWREGLYTGGETIFPQYRAALALGHGDVVVFYNHEWHGNAPIVGKPKQFRRCTLVFYTREDMQECGDPADEQKRADGVFESRVGR